LSRKGKKVILCGEIISKFQKEAPSVPSSFLTKRVVWEKKSVEVVKLKKDFHPLFLSVKNLYLVINQ